jgi:hypothetical protein
MYTKKIESKIKMLKICTQKIVSGKIIHLHMYNLELKVKANKVVNDSSSNHTENHKYMVREKGMNKPFFHEVIDHLDEVHTYLL